MPLNQAAEQRTPETELKALLTRLGDNGFSGKVVASFQEGRIYHVKIEVTMTAGDLLSRKQMHL